MDHKNVRLVILLFASGGSCGNPYGYRLDTAAIVTGLLHDAVEDTVATIEEIEFLFGEEVASSLMVLRNSQN